MVLYPDVQSKARQELDTVVGRDRLPWIFGTGGSDLSTEALGAWSRFGDTGLGLSPAHTIIPHGTVDTRYVLAAAQ